MTNRNGTQYEVVFNITNDLGDELLWEPIDLAVKAHVALLRTQDSACAPLAGRKLQWDAAKRVMKLAFHLPPTIQGALDGGQPVYVSISSANPALSADSIRTILSSCAQDGRNGQHGLIFTVFVALQGPEAEKNACSRQILLTGPGEPAEYLTIREQMGESIARHIWDAGLVSMSAIAGTFTFPDSPTSQSSCLTRVHEILNQAGGVNVLELGCGVGILSLGLSAVLRSGMGERHMLMTDCRDAEERARSNMSLLHQQQSGLVSSSAQVMYENLDWDDGRLGCFESRVRDRRWHLIMLSDCTYNADSIPALVETLSALHHLNKDFPPPFPGAASDTWSTKVFLATKPRHVDEMVLFDLLAAEEWKICDEIALSLPVLGGDSDRVEMYLFEKI